MLHINVTVNLSRPLAQQLNKEERCERRGDHSRARPATGTLWFRVLKMWLLVVLFLLLVWAVGTYRYLFGVASPFSLESVRPPGPREFDQKKRDKVIKQGKVNVNEMLA